MPRAAHWLGSIRSATRFAARPRWSRTARFWPAATASCTSSISTAAPAWPRSNIDSPTGATPAVLGDYAYFGTQGSLFFAIDWKKAESRLALQERTGDAVSIVGRGDRVAGLCRWSGQTGPRHRHQNGRQSLDLLHESSRRLVASRRGRAAKKFGITKRAANSPPRPPWPRTAWSSATRTAPCTGLDRKGRQIGFSLVDERRSRRVIAKQTVGGNPDSRSQLSCRGRELALVWNRDQPGKTAPRLYTWLPKRYARAKSCVRHSATKLPPTIQRQITANRKLPPTANYRQLQFISSDALPTSDT